MVISYNIRRFSKIEVSFDDVISNVLVQVSGEFELWRPNAFYFEGPIFSQVGFRSFQYNASTTGKTWSNCHSSSVTSYLKLGGLKTREVREQAPSDGFEKSRLVFSLDFLTPNWRIWTTGIVQICFIIGFGQFVWLGGSWRLKKLALCNQDIYDLIYLFYF